MKSNEALLKKDLISKKYIGKHDIIAVGLAVVSENNQNLRVYYNSKCPSKKIMADIKKLASPFDVIFQEQPKAYLA